MSAPKDSDRRIGVFICHCGGNISDYVDVEKVREAVAGEPGVVTAKTTMFACSDAAQQEMIEAIGQEKLDGIVVASCSPKLHLFTFRAMAQRAGLNPYRYIQANIREQCSWAHRGQVPEATEKATSIVRAAIAKARASAPLSTMRIKTQPRVLVVGAGVAGLRAALALSDMGLTVYIVEREERAGGWAVTFGKTFARDRSGSDMIQMLLRQVAQRDNIVLYTRAEVTQKTGSVGDFTVELSIAGQEKVTLNVGAIVVATGFESYQPREGEFGWGLPGVVTLPQYKVMLDAGEELRLGDGKPVRSVAFVYCVGSRQGEEARSPHRYCSRFCCSAACHAAVVGAQRAVGLHQVHLYRDMRTYGKYETLYEEAQRQGSVFLRWDPSEPPVVELDEGHLLVRVKDHLLGGEELEIPADLVVLVTGMVPRENATLVNALKLPIGGDGFFNEIHPKLRPVETVVDGVFIAGAAQGPKTIAESVASSLAAVSKSAALLLKGYVDLEPFVAEVDEALCTWCGKCLEACPYEAIEKVAVGGKEVARVIPSLCKGCGACAVPCAANAINVRGYTDEQVLGMIDALLKEAVG
ncbi:MAG: CoB--CoM heterodisulfide reductase iron-sulfur subunit A family protein [Acidobacteriota bacterium]